MGQIGRNFSLWSWAVLLLMLPIAYFSPILLGFVLFLVLLLVAIRRWTFGFFLTPSPLNLAVLFLLGSMFMSYVAMFDHEVSIAKITGIVAGIALYYSVIHFASERSIWPIVIAYILMGFLVALVGLFGSEWPAPFTFINNVSELLPLKRSGLLSGTVSGAINLNELAGVLCWIAPILLAFSIGLRRKIAHKSLAIYYLLVLGTIFVVFLLLATSSRGGILGFSMGALLVLAMYVRGHRKLVASSTVLLSLLIVLVYSSNQAATDIVGDTFGLSGRVEIWSRALLALQDHPLTGVSVNGFRQVVHQLYPLFGISRDIDIAHAHNHLLQAGLDLGLPGLISYLAIWILSGGLLFTTLRSLIRRGANHHPYYSLATGLAGALLAGWIFGLFDTVALGSRPGFLWWLLIGMTVAVHHEVRFSGKQLRVYRRVSMDRLSPAPEPASPIIGDNHGMRDGL